MQVLKYYIIKVVYYSIGLAHYSIGLAPAIDLGVVLLLLHL